MTTLSKLNNVLYFRDYLESEERGEKRGEREEADTLAEEVNLDFPAETEILAEMLVDSTRF